MLILLLYRKQNFPATQLTAEMNKEQSNQLKNPYTAKRFLIARRHKRHPLCVKKCGGNKS
jgi:hypothetical protein